MAEYIERRTAIEAAKHAWAKGLEPSQYIETLPAADVAPVVRGRWVTPRWHNSDYCYNCSECGGEAMHREYQWARNGIYPICPNCGAKMDGGEDHAVS